MCVRSPFVRANFRRYSTCCQEQRYVMSPVYAFFSCIKPNFDIYIPKGLTIISKCDIVFCSLKWDLCASSQKTRRRRPCIGPNTAPGTDGEGTRGRWPRLAFHDGTTPRTRSSPRARSRSLRIFRDEIICTVLPTDVEDTTLPDESQWSHQEERWKNYPNRFRLVPDKSIRRRTRLDSRRPRPLHICRKNTRGVQESREVNARQERRSR